MQVLHEQVTITDVTGSSNNIGTVFVPKSVLFTTWESKQLDRGASRVAVNVENSLIAVGWNDNKAINFISTADSTDCLREEKNQKWKSRDTSTLSHQELQHVHGWSRQAW